MCVSERERDRKGERESEKLPRTRERERVFKRKREREKKRGKEGGYRKFLPTLLSGPSQTLVESRGWAQKEQRKQCLHKKQA